jgi:hypothetical protein
LFKLVLMGGVDGKQIGRMALARLAFRGFDESAEELKADR